MGASEDPQNDEIVLRNLVRKLRSKLRVFMPIIFELVGGHPDGDHSYEWLADEARKVLRQVGNFRSCDKHRRILYAATTPTNEDGSYCLGCWIEERERESALAVVERLERTAAEHIYGDGRRLISIGGTHWDAIRAELEGEGGG